MTLIACTGSNGFGAISDVALSNEAAEKKALTIPMRGSAQTEFKSSISGAARKTLIRNDTLLMWAGRYDVAREIFRRVLAASNDGRDRVDIADIIRQSGMNEREIQDVSIIYCHIDDRTLNRQYHSCIHNQAYGHDLIFSGSGHWDFFENTKSDRGDVLTFFYRAVVNLYLETSTENTFSYNYGMWFELFGESAEEGLFQVPFAIKFWSIDGDILRLGHPLVFSWYDDTTLYVANAHGQNSPVDNISVHAIQDILGLTAVTENVALRWEPKILFHFIHNRNLNQLRGKWEAGPDKSLSIGIEGNSTVCEIKREVLDEFLSAKFWEGSADDAVHKDIH